MSHHSQHITLSELQSHIKESLKRDVGGYYWVVAEVSEISIKGGAGHCYLTLVEKVDGMPMAKARVNANIWAGKYAILKHYFVSQAGRDIEVGMKLLLRATVNYHELYGISLNIIDIDPTYTLGEIELQRQRVIKELKDNGLLDLNKSVVMPDVLQNIAVISSLTAAGFQDFEKELRGNEFGFKYALTLFNTTMQGAGAENSIIQSLRNISCQYDKFDAIVIIRGGGAQSDLACFNQFDLCCEIASMPLGVITGIGHDKDVSVADMTASVSLKTPTAVARYLIDKSRILDDRISNLMEYFKSFSVDFLDKECRRVEQSAQKLKITTSEAVHVAEKNIEMTRSTIKYTSTRLIEHYLNQNITKKEKLNNLSEKHLISSKIELEQKLEILKVGVYKYINQQKQTFERSKLMIQGYDPQRILKNGYAIAKLNNKIIRSKKDVHIGDTINLNLFDGEIKSKITDIL